MLPTKHIPVPLASPLHPLALNDSVCSPMPARTTVISLQIKFWVRAPPYFESMEMEPAGSEQDPISVVYFIASKIFYVSVCIPKLMYVHYIHA